MQAFLLLFSISGKHFPFQEKFEKPKASEQSDAFGGHLWVLRWAPALAGRKSVHAFAAWEGMPLSIISGCGFAPTLASKQPISP